MRDQDIALEIFTENGKMKIPYERGIAWDPCLFSRWMEPDCIPGIGSKVYTDKELTDKEIAEALEKSLSSGGPDVHQMATHTRPYILVIHGNDQFVEVYPEQREIAAGDPHFELVKRHFYERGLEFVRESIIPPIKGPEHPLLVALKLASVSAALSQ